jgi:hypothetical protein
MRKVIQATILLTSIFGCGPSVTFNQPQPVATKSLSHFPEKIRGDYFSSNQPLVITVRDTMILKTFDYHFKVHKDSLDTTVYLKGDTLIEKESGEKMKVNLLGDTITLHVHEVDTMFVISDGSVLRKYKGYYFLNARQDKNAWSVQKLSLTKGLLTIGNISSEADIDNLKELTETKEDTTTYNFRLTKKQFKNFIKDNGFSNQDTFKLMTKNSR